MFQGGLPSFISALVASAPAKVAAITVASAGTVVAGVPIVQEITDAGAAEVQVVATADGTIADGPITTTSSAPTTAAPTSVPPTSSTTTTEPRETIPLEIGCERVELDDGGSKVVCEYTQVLTEHGATYRILRNGAVIATFADEGEAGWANWYDLEPDHTGSSYAVMLVDEDGVVVASSDVAVVPAWVPAPTTTTEKPATEVTEPKKGDDGKDDSKDDDKEKEEVEWEGIGLWCGRAEGGTAVVCEIGITERDDFGSYVLKRDGVPIWTYGQRTQPGRPWPDVRYVDEGAPSAGAKYTAYIKDSDGNWVGGSGHVWIEPVNEPEPTTTTTPPESTTTTAPESTTTTAPESTTTTAPESTTTTTAPESTTTTTVVD